MSQPAIPPHAKRVYKGLIFEVWQWDQELFDGSSTTFERVRRVDTARVIAIVDGKILIEEERQPGTDTYLSIGGGRCEWGEDPLAAAKRELLEEAGLESDDWRIWKKVSPFHQVVFTVHIFIARQCRKVKEPEHDAGEQMKLRYVSFDEFLELPPHRFPPLHPH